MENLIAAADASAAAAVGNAGKSNTNNAADNNGDGRGGGGGGGGGGGEDDDDLSQPTNAAVIAASGDFVQNNALVIEQMFTLKEARDVTLKKIRYFRSQMRFPVPEAAYRGNWQIIRKIFDRRLFHYNFSHTWMFPSPPPPFIRVIRKMQERPPKLDMFEIMTQGMNDLAPGQYVENIGWVGPNDPREHFGECQHELTLMWKEIKREHKRVHDERLKLRRLTNERMKQEAAVPLMVEAIMSRDYRRAIYLAQECGVSIDMETPQGVTALVGAAEEDTGRPFYTPMYNDDHTPCLQVQYTPPPPF